MTWIRLLLAKYSNLTWAIDKAKIRIKIYIQLLGHLWFFTN